MNATASDGNINSNSFYDQYVYTVPYDGTYFVAFSQRMVDGDNNRDFQVRITKNTTEVTTVATGGGTWVNWISGTVVGIVRAKAGDEIHCQSSGGGTNSYQTANGRVSIARIY